MLIRDEILRLKPYAPGLSAEWVAARYNLPVKEVIKLASAENPLGASPAAERAIADALARVSQYPEWKASDLRERLAATHHVEPDAIVVGEDVRQVNASYDETVDQASSEAERQGWMLVQDTAWQGYETIPVWLMEG